jgi:hypothetical protein
MTCLLEELRILPCFAWRLVGPGIIFLDIEKYFDSEFEIFHLFLESFFERENVLSYFWV